MVFTIEIGGIPGAPLGSDITSSPNSTPPPRAPSPRSPSVCLNAVGSPMACHCAFLLFLFQFRVLPRWICCLWCFPSCVSFNFQPFYPLANPLCFLMGDSITVPQCDSLSGEKKLLIDFIGSTQGHITLYIYSAHT
uniref:Uncharacterized protein n=1 Tax=Sphaerodactylus townsendi TaxID=933632 RepID=A0ACB8EUJ1_9SAUR